jgi:hypothetical protein
VHVIPIFAAAILAAASVLELNLRQSLFQVGDHVLHLFQAEGDLQIKPS